jgi:hypothetical protein
MTPKEAAAVEALRVAIKALPTSLKIEAEDFSDHNLLLVWKRSSDGGHTCAAKIPCRTL